MSHADFLKTTLFETLGKQKQNRNTMKKSILSTITVIAVMLTSIFVFDGCKKPKDGINGKDGATGATGNANVTSSNTVTLNNWTEDFNDGVNYSFHSTVSWASITQAIKDKGVVMAYADDGAGGWIALPYTDAGDDYYSMTVNFSFKVGSVDIIINGFDDITPYVASDWNGTVVRIVAIASSSRMAHPDVDLKNYNEVKKVFNLKD